MYPLCVRGFIPPPPFSLSLFENYLEHQKQSYQMAKEQLKTSTTEYNVHKGVERS